MVNNTLIYYSLNIEQTENQSKNNSRNKNSNTNTLETVDFKNKKIRINSPKSKQALLSLGLSENELYEISMKEYIENHPELKKASSEVQEKRYNHYEQRRIKSINEAKEMRQQLYEEEQSSKENNKEKEDIKGTQEEIIKKELEKLEPVSYTHLTLPTILLV